MEIHNDDCMNIFKDIPDESIDLIVTDPPYHITSRGNAGNSGGMMLKKQSMDGKIFEHNDISCREYAPEFYRVLKDGTHCYVMCNHINLLEMLNTFNDAGFRFTKSLIWMKDNKIMGTKYMSQFEYILFFSKGKNRQINNCGTSDILQVNNKKMRQTKDNLHDTEKPVELMKVLIENSSNKDDTVLDPFMGIGSTGVACKISHRNFIGIEVDGEYFKIAEHRLKVETAGTRKLF